MTVQEDKFIAPSEHPQAGELDVRGLSADDHTPGYIGWFRYRKRGWAANVFRGVQSASLWPGTSEAYGDFYQPAPSGGVAEDWQMVGADLRAATLEFLK